MNTTSTPGGNASQDGTGHGPTITEQHGRIGAVDVNIAQQNTIDALQDLHDDATTTVGIAMNKHEDVNADKVMGKDAWSALRQDLLLEVSEIVAEHQHGISGKTMGELAWVILRHDLLHEVNKVFDGYEWYGKAGKIMDEATWLALRHDLLSEVSEIIDKQLSELLKPAAALSERTRRTTANNFSAASNDSPQACTASLMTEASAQSAHAGTIQSSTSGTQVKPVVPAAACNNPSPKADDENASPSAPVIGAAPTDNEQPPPSPASNLPSPAIDGNSAPSPPTSNTLSANQQHPGPPPALGTADDGHRDDPLPSAQILVPAEESDSSVRAEMDKQGETALDDALGGELQADDDETLANDHFGEEEAPRYLHLGDEGHHEQHGQYDGYEDYDYEDYDDQDYDDDYIWW